MASSTARTLWIALLTVPIIVGAVFAFVLGFQPAQAWQVGESSAGAPVDVLRPEDMTNARRSALEAQSQAGFVVSGTQQLSKGSQQLADGSGELRAGIDELVAGTQELRDGMVQLQAGTGQLGDGATELADGVETAVNQVIGLNAVRGQLLEAINNSLRELERANSAEARQARGTLTSLRDQVEVVNFDQATGPLTKLRDGSRELSNQLNVSGYAYHDGIYSATEGTRKLHEGALALQDGAKKLNEGTDELTEGSDKVATMAELNKTKADAVARALPATAPGMETRAGAADSYPAAGSISPVVALLISALVMLGGVAVGWAAHVRGARPGVLLALATVGATVMGTVLMWLLAGATTLTGLLLGAVVLALAFLGTALSTVVAARALVPGWGVTAAFVLIGVCGAAQAGISAWVWKTATVADVAPVWSALANLTPLNWATTGVTTAGNGGNFALLIASVAVLIGVLVIAAIGTIATRRAAVMASTPTAAGPVARDSVL
ncbi:MAG: hypothetical protein SOW59_01825 [Corynebacterium sp.]|nr:hypothetical protein [Corynebacterium sp.]